MDIKQTALDFWHGSDQKRNQIIKDLKKERGWGLPVFGAARRVAARLSSEDAPFHVIADFEKMLMTDEKALVPTIASRLHEDSVFTQRVARYENEEEEMSSGRPLEAKDIQVLNAQMSEKEGTSFSLRALPRLQGRSFYPEVQSVEIRYLEARKKIEEFEDEEALDILEKTFQSLNNRNEKKIFVDRLKQDPQFAHFTSHFEPLVLSKERSLPDSQDKQADKKITATTQAMKLALQIASDSSSETSASAWLNFLSLEEGLYPEERSLLRGAAAKPLVASPSDKQKSEYLIKCVNYMKNKEDFTQRVKAVEFLASYAKNRINQSIIELYNILNGRTSSKNVPGSRVASETDTDKTGTAPEKPDSSPVTGLTFELDAGADSYLVEQEVDRLLNGLIDDSNLKNLLEHAGEENYDRHKHQLLEKAQSHVKLGPFLRNLDRIPQAQGTFARISYLESLISDAKKHPLAHPEIQNILGFIEQYKNSLKNQPGLLSSVLKKLTEIRNQKLPDTEAVLKTQIVFVTKCLKDPQYEPIKNSLSRLHKNLLSQSIETADLESLAGSDPWKQVMLIEAARIILADSPDALAMLKSYENRREIREILDQVRQDRQQAKEIREIPAENLVDDFLNNALDGMDDFFNEEETEPVNGTGESLPEKAMYSHLHGSLVLWPENMAVIAARLLAALQEDAGKASYTVENGLSKSQIDPVDGNSIKSASEAIRQLLNEDLDVDQLRFLISDVKKKQNQTDAAFELLSRMEDAIDEKKQEIFESGLLKDLDNLLGRKDILRYMDSRLNSDPPEVFRPVIMKLKKYYLSENNLPETETTVNDWVKTTIEDFGIRTPFLAAANKVEKSLLEKITAKTDEIISERTIREIGKRTNEQIVAVRSLEELSEELSKRANRMEKLVFLNAQKKFGGAGADPIVMESVKTLYLLFLAASQNGFTILKVFADRLKLDFNQKKTTLKFLKSNEIVKQMAGLSDDDLAKAAVYVLKSTQPNRKAVWLYLEAFKNNKEKNTGYKEFFGITDAHITEIMGMFASENDKKTAIFDAEEKTIEKEITAATEKTAGIKTSPEQSKSHEANGNKAEKSQETGMDNSHNQSLAEKSEKKVEAFESPSMPETEFEDEQMQYVNETDEEEWIEEENEIENFAQNSIHGLKTSFLKDEESLPEELEEELEREVTEEEESIDFLEPENMENNFDEPENEDGTPGNNTDDEMFNQPGLEEKSVNEIPMSAERTNLREAGLQQLIKKGQLTGLLEYMSSLSMEQVKQIIEKDLLPAVQGQTKQAMQKLSMLKKLLEGQIGDDGLSQYFGQEASTVWGFLEAIRSTKPEIENEKKDSRLQAKKETSKPAAKNRNMISGKPAAKAGAIPVSKPKQKIQAVPAKKKPAAPVPMKNKKTVAQKTEAMTLSAATQKILNTLQSPLTKALLSMIKNMKSSAELKQFKELYLSKDSAAALKQAAKVYQIAPESMIDDLKNVRLRFDNQKIKSALEKQLKKVSKG